MPYRTPSKTSAPKRARYEPKFKSKKKPTYKRKPMIVDIGKNPFPMMLKNQLVYMEQATISLTTGAYNSIQFGTNNLYDPRTGVGGHQPRYYDQLIAIYDHYTVVSSFVEVSMIIGTSAPTGITWGMYVDDDTGTTATSISDLIEMPGARYSTQNNMQVPTKLSLGWSAMRTFGNAQPWTDPEMQGTSGAGPSETSQFTIGMSDAALVSGTYTFNVKITYNVVWDEYKYVGPS